MTGSIKIPTVSNFLCYFELITGGLVLGWFDVVLFGLLLLGLIFDLIFGMVIIEALDLNSFTVLGERILMKILNFNE